MGLDARFREHDKTLAGSVTPAHAGVQVLKAQPQGPEMGLGARFREHDKTLAGSVTPAQMF